MRKTWTTMKMTGLAAVVVLAASACATRGFARAEDAIVDAKVDTLAGTVEETQERTLQNGEQISVVDMRAQQANTNAASANAAAGAAQMAADDAAGRVGAVENRIGRLIMEVTLNEAQGNFALGRSELPPTVQSSIDRLVTMIHASGGGGFLEIEGHTDSSGGEAFNIRLGQRRADAVKDYLYRQHNVPLHKMNTISFGESQPAASNDTPEGRAQNRRVVIKVRS